MCVIYIGLSISEGQQTRHETRRQVRNLAVFTVAYCIISLALFLSLSQKGGRRADWLPAVPAMPTRYQTCNQAETDNDDVHFLTRFLCPSSWKKNKKFNLLMSGKGKPEIRLNFVAEWSLYLFLMANSSVYDKNVARQWSRLDPFLIRQHMRNPDENKETPLPAAASLSLSYDLPSIFGLDWKPTPEFFIFYFFALVPMTRWHVSMMFFRLFSSYLF